MSAFDPLAAFAAQVVANADAAIEQATLDLGAVVQELRAQISVGDVIIAYVLPPQDGNDRIEILGQTVVAQLPPGINPGESIAVQVTGFTNTAVLVRNLGPADPENPPQPPELPPPPAAAAPAATAVLTTRLPPASTTANDATRLARTGPPPQPSAPLAPPRELFVAASVQERAIPEEVSVEAEPAPPDLEARLAVTRANIAPTPPPGARATPAPSATSSTSEPAMPAASRPSTPSSGRITVPPIITPARTEAAPAAANVPAAPKPSAPEAALLARLRVPVTTTTLAAARAMNNAAQNITTTYQKLDQLLASAVPDERTTALRTMLAFVARLDLRNVRTLPEQIASFVSNVVDGAESKIAQIVRALNDAVASSVPEHEVSPSPEMPQTPPVVPAAIEARVAERAIALDHDVKAAILALIETPPAGTTPQTIAGLRQALTATNALQLNVLSSKTNDPNVINIPLPAYFYEGGKPAHLQISRDAPDGRTPMNADNFRVAFILDTKSLGTVAIDLQTVGRNVTVDVKTQATLFADRFRSTLGDLRSRLERLHYRVASIGAGVAVSQQPAKLPPSATQEHRSNLDMRA